MKIKQLYQISAQKHSFKWSLKPFKVQIYMYIVACIISSYSMIKSMTRMASNVLMAR